MQSEESSWDLHRTKDSLGKSQYAHIVVCVYNDYVTHIGCSLSLCFLSLFREDAAVAIRDGEQQLAMLQRQSTMSQMYPSAKSVME